MGKIQWNTRQGKIGLPCQQVVSVYNVHSIWIGLNKYTLYCTIWINSAPSVTCDMQDGFITWLHDHDTSENFVQYPWNWLWILAQPYFINTKMPDGRAVRWRENFLSLHSFFNNFKAIWVVHDMKNQFNKLVPWAVTQPKFHAGTWVHDMWPTNSFKWYSIE